MARFDKFNAAQSGATVATTDSAPTPPTNGTSPSTTPVKREVNGTSKKRPSPTPDEDDDDALSSVADTPPPKRKKIEKSQAETDAEYAKRLQAELNRVTGRLTRGGGAGAKRKPVVKKQRKKKSKAHVGSDDDSDAGSQEKREVKRTGGFHVCQVSLSRDERRLTCSRNR
jgi:upstream activation factor subunit UAF30